ncbi:MAG: RusA family crossover junction endodeoxyribonuclease [Nitrospiraceae bacterium]
MPRPQRTSRLPPTRLPIRLVSYRKDRQTPIVPSTEISLQPMFRISRRPSHGSTHNTIPPGTGTVSPHSLSLTLPVPPSVNHQYATVNGRRLLSAAGRNYKSQVGHHIVLALARTLHREAFHKTLRSDVLALSIRFYFTSRLRRDVDGGLKIAQDALCEGLGINDNRIVETHLYKDLDKQCPRIEICLTSAINQTSPGAPQA